MDQLSAQQQQDIKKASTDRLREYLIKAGYAEDIVLAYDRNALMEAYAQLLVTPPTVEPWGATGVVGLDMPEQADKGQAEESELDLRKRQLALQEREIRLREKELDDQRGERERQ